MNGGLPNKENQFIYARSLVMDHNVPVANACRTANISRITYARWNNKLYRKVSIKNRIKKLLRLIK